MNKPIIKSPMSYDECFMRHVYITAAQSKDPKTKIGSIITRKRTLLSEGFNGLPQKVIDYEERYERPAKYEWVIHSELNSVLLAARNGTVIEGGTLYTQGIPCSGCARALIQSGIREIVVHKQWQELESKTNWKKWIESAKISKQMFKESRVKVRVFDKYLGVDAYINGEKHKI